MDGPEDLHTSTVDGAAAFERGRALDEGDDDYDYDEDFDVDEDHEYDEDYCACGDTLHCPACG